MNTVSSISIQKYTKSLSGANQSLPDALPSEMPWPLFGWTKSINGWLLFLFFCTTLFIEGAGQQRFLGVLLCGAFALSCVLRRDFAWLRNPPVELMVHSLWVLWAGLTGIFAAESLPDYWNVLRVILQLLALVWVVYGMIAQRPEMLSGLLMGVLAGNIILIGSVLLGADTLIIQEGDRAMGLTSNSNVLGIYMTFAFLITLWYWVRVAQGNNWGRFVVFLSWLLIAYVLVASGSRKSFLGFSLALGLWLVWASTLHSGIMTVMIRLLLLGAIAAASYLYIPQLLKDTTLGKRFDKFEESGGGDLTAAAEKNIRYQMYVDGIQMAADNPLFGVGLGNFNRHFYTGHYSHSNLIEPLATTGFIGFILYQCIYITIMLKSLRLMRSSDVAIRYQLKIIVITILILLFLGVGAPWQTSPLVYGWLAAFSAYMMQMNQGSLVAAGGALKR